jgi:micrococcal nuclease
MLFPFRLRRKTSLLGLFILLLLAVSQSLQAPSSFPPPLPSQTPVAVASPRDSTHPESTSSAQPAEFLVKRVVDGDTIVLENGQKVRYIGIDAPESVDPRRGVECYGKEAAGRNRTLVEGKTIRLEKDVSETDRYGRLLRYVYLGGIMVNEALVREGYAQASSYPPDVAYDERFRSAQALAKIAHVGLWGACSR